MPTYNVKNSFMHNGAIQLVGKTVELPDESRTRILLRTGFIELAPVAPPAAPTEPVDVVPRGAKKNND